MYNLISKLPEFNIKNRTVFLRADLNITQNNKVFKLKTIQPTLDFLIAKQAKIILATHIGRPRDLEPNIAQQTLSTKNLLPWFEQNNYNILFAKDIDQAKKLNENLLPAQIILLENLRFFEGEQSANKTKKIGITPAEFADSLASLADYYVNDAFGEAHRNDTSVTLLPKLFDIDHKTIGFLIEKELKILNTLLGHPKKPFIIIMAGSKVKDKLPLIKNLNRADSILICPAIVFTFLKSLGKETGKSLVDDLLLNKALEIIKIGSNLVFPVDYQVSNETMAGQLFYTQNSEIPKDAVGISIGPKTLEVFQDIISNAGTIFLNGTMGFAEYPETEKMFETLLQAISLSNAYSVVGGGDAVAAVYKYGLESAINFCSTGGGATLSYLSGENLPGIDSILE